jgi:hypothetical protein
MQARCLWFRRNLNRELRARLRRVLESGDYLGTLAACASLFRKPLALGRFRLGLAFSSGDAAETAVFHGGLCLFFSSLHPLLSRAGPEINLSPRFSSRRELSLDCDISLTLPASVFFFRMITLSIRKKRRAHV